MVKLGGISGQWNFFMSGGGGDPVNVCAHSLVSIQLNSK